MLGGVVSLMLFWNRSLPAGDELLEVRQHLVADERELLGVDLDDATSPIEAAAYRGNDRWQAPGREVTAWLESNNELGTRYAILGQTFGLHHGHPGKMLQTNTAIGVSVHLANAICATLSAGVKT